MYKLLPSSDTDPHPQLLQQSMSVLQFHTEANKDHNYFTCGQCPTTARTKTTTKPFKQISDTNPHPFTAYTITSASDKTADEHIEMIGKDQPNCHKHQSPIALPPLKPLP